MPVGDILLAGRQIIVLIEFFNRPDHILSCQVLLDKLIQPPKEVSSSAINGYLEVLKKANLIEFKNRTGNTRYYKITDLGHSLEKSLINVLEKNKITSLNFYDKNDMKYTLCLSKLSTVENEHCEYTLHNDSKNISLTETFKIEPINQSNQNTIKKFKIIPETNTNTTEKSPFKNISDKTNVPFKLAFSQSTAVDSKSPNSSSNSYNTAYSFSLLKAVNHYPSKEMDNFIKDLKNEASNYPSSTNEASSITTNLKQQADKRKSPESSDEEVKDAKKNKSTTNKSDDYYKFLEDMSNNSESNKFSTDSPSLTKT